MEIDGIILSHNKVIISASADDKVLYLLDVNSLKKSIRTLPNFQLFSGLGINWEKS